MNIWVFLILGTQIAMFIRYSSITRINRSSRDEQNFSIYPIIWDSDDTFWIIIES